MHFSKKFNFMKYIQYFILSCLCLWSLNVKCQLSGNAFLLGQTNHSGIKAVFLSQDGTAVTDSTITNSAGSYSINITSGVYKIVFSKPGYLTSNYNNGTSTLLTNTVVLNNDTLFPGNQVFISGNVSGNWTNNNTYFITGDITIPSGDTLSIQAGTSVRFMGYYSVIDNGVLLATGTSSSPVLFTSNSSTPAISDWNSIQINNSASVINNCVIEYAAVAINFNNSDPVISNNVVRSAFLGIDGNYGSPHVFNNEVYNIHNTSTAAVGIWVSGANGIVECNHVHDCSSSGWNGYGIITYASKVRNNIIHDISGGVATGIQTRGGSNTSNNYIYNCGTGLSVSNPTTTPYPVIRNNTITNCSTYGVLVDDNSGTAYNPSILNNIIVNCHTGMYQANSQPAGYTVSNNLVWNNSAANYSNVQVTGIGVIVSTNSNGDPIDSYYNLSQDPLFAGGQAPVLSSGSPCINGGDTIYSHNIGYDTAYSCTSIVTGVSSLPFQGPAIIVYPNPSNGTFCIKQNSNEPHHVEMYDIHGKMVLNQVIQGKTTIETIGLDSGIYSLILKGTAGVSIQKIVIAR